MRNLQAKKELALGLLEPAQSNIDPDTTLGHTTT